MKGFKPIFPLALSLMCMYSIHVSAQFSQTVHREAAPGEIPISKPGSYDKTGATYILVNDISSA